MAAVDTDLPENIRQDIKLADEDAKAAKAATAATLAERRRDWIATWIIWVLVGSVAAGLVISVIEGVAGGSWQTASMHALDLIKSVVLPVVTLVLGYYFGQESKP